MTGALKTNKPVPKAPAEVYVWRFMLLSRRCGDGLEAPGHRPTETSLVLTSGRFDQPRSDAVALTTHG